MYFQHDFSELANLILFFDAVLLELKREFRIIFLNQHFPALGVIFGDFLMFITLAVLAYLAIAALRGVFSRLIKVEAMSALDRWGGLALGFLRSVFLISLLLIALYLSPINYFKESVKKSYLGSSLSFVDVRAYEFIFNTIVSKFYPEESLNKDIYEVLEE